MVTLALPALFALTPTARGVYKQTLEGWPRLSVYGILQNRLRLEHFLAQILHESGGFRVLVENLNYSALRMTQVWPSRFPTVESAQPYAHQPRLLANKVYGGRLGNVDPDDGWRYCGRGLLQLTGRGSYKRVGERLGLDLVHDPDLVLQPTFALVVAGTVWSLALASVAADADHLARVTKAINGGQIGVVDRQRWLTKVRAGNAVLED